MRSLTAVICSARLAIVISVYNRGRLRPSPRLALGELEEAALVPSPLPRLRRVNAGSGESAEAVRRTAD